MNNKFLGLIYLLQAKDNCDIKLIDNWYNKYNREDLKLLCTQIGSTNGLIFQDHWEHEKQ